MRATPSPPATTNFFPSGLKSTSPTGFPPAGRTAFTRIPRSVVRRSRERLGGELPTAGPMSLVACVAALRERVDGDRRENRNENERADRKPDQAPMALGGGGPLRFELPLGLVLRPPGEHGLGEDIVEDLVARAFRPVLRGTDDPLFDEPLEHVLRLGLSDRCVAGEIAGPMGDLHARRSDEMVVHRGRGVLLVRRELCHRAIQMILDDVRRTAELAQSLEPEPVRAAAHLDLPEPLEDELEVRSLDPVGVLLA